MNKKYLVSKTYSIVTEESAKIGDFAECGYVWEDLECDSLDEVATLIINELGYIDGLWDGQTDFYGCDPDIDLTDGSETYYACHVNNLTDKELDQLAEIIKNK